MWVVCSESHYSVLFCADRLVVSRAGRRSHEPQEETKGNCRGGAGAACVDERKGSSVMERDNEAAVGKGGSGGGGHRNTGVRGEVAAAAAALESFDLEYYDGLGRQDEVRRVCIHTYTQGSEQRGNCLTSVSRQYLLTDQANSFTVVTVTPCN